MADDFYDLDSDDSDFEEDDNRLTLLNRRSEQGDDNDTFDEEMSKELNAHIKTILQTYSKPECNTDAKSSQDQKENDEIEMVGEMSNDDLLYDPMADEEDQNWVDEKRHLYLQDKLPKSDAVLNCPSCMSLLCLDCQRHEIYKTQYRAMFVSNCRVNTDQTLQYPQKKGKSRRPSTEKTYNPVTCSICDTDVAVLDEEEVYHFFNVLSSFA